MNELLMSFSANVDLISYALYMYICTVAIDIDLGARNTAR